MMTLKTQAGPDDQSGRVQDLSLSALRAKIWIVGIFSISRGWPKKNQHSMSEVAANMLERLR
jgi:hypothetical protein